MLGFHLIVWSLIRLPFRVQLVQSQKGRAQRQAQKTWHFKSISNGSDSNASTEGTQLAFDSMDFRRDGARHSSRCTGSKVLS
jgi:hypothetical protein